MVQRKGSQRLFQRELRHLTEELTEMALLAEELFGASARALIGRDRFLARQVAEGAGVGPSEDEAGETVHARTLELLQEWISVEGNVRSLLMIQQSATELERIGDHARRIATHALALTIGTGPYLPSLGRAIGGDLLALIRVVAGQLRGCAEMLSAPATETAQQLAAADEEVDRVYLRLVAELQEAMTRTPEWALLLTRLLFASHEMECIGNRVGNICENISYMLAYWEPAASSNGGSRAAI
ncbi:MAG TPA: PhoU domain-containing protein [Ktedonobacterales bacterium]|nr:PhoU domain-containing protein [Ktedonobacterales bacterium]